MECGVAIWCQPGIDNVRKKKNSTAKVSKTHFSNSIWIAIFFWKLKTSVFRNGNLKIVVWGIDSYQSDQNIRKNTLYTLVACSRLSTDRKNDSVIFSSNTFTFTFNNVVCVITYPSAWLARRNIIFELDCTDHSLQICSLLNHHNFIH